jgi:hypothetical protein
MILEFKNTSSDTTVSIQYVINILLLEFPRNNYLTQQTLLQKKNEISLICTEVCSTTQSSLIL